MKARSFIKGFDDGAIGKVVAPADTCVSVLAALRRVRPSIYRGRVFIDRPTGIPQYRIIGTEHFRQVTGLSGTNGKGHTDDQALASGIMELVERYSCHKFRRESWLASSWKERGADALFSLKDFYSQFLDPRAARAIGDEKASGYRIRWYKGYSAEGKQAYIPVGLVRSVLQCANGMAAGNTFEEAFLHAVCEVMERHCVTLVKYAGCQAPAVDQATIRLPAGRELIRKCRLIDPQLQIRDFSLGLGLPVIGVITRSGRGNCLVTAGCATNPAEALVRALTETSQACGTGGATDRVAGLRHCFSSSNAVPFSSLPSVSNRDLRLELEAVTALLAARGFKLFYVDMTDPALKIPCVDVFIAGAKYFRREARPRSISAGLLLESIAIGDTAAAREHIAAGIRRGGREEGFYQYYRGMLLMRTGRRKEAIGAFQSAAGSREIPLRADAFAWLGACCESGGDRQAAAAAYTRQLDLSRGERSGIVAGMSKPLIAFPFDPFIKVKSLYEAVRSARWYSGATPQKAFIRDFVEFLARRDSLRRALTVAIRSYGNRRWDTAAGSVNAALAAHGLSGKVYELRRFLADCRKRAGDYVSAIRELRKAERMDPDNATINFELAACHKKTGETGRYAVEVDKGARKISSRLRMRVGFSSPDNGRAGWSRQVW